jgi:subtilisin family serine protease
MQMVDKQTEGQEPQVRYFMPDRLVFLVEHEDALKQDSVAAQLAKVPQLAKYDHLVAALGKAAARVTTFESTERAAFSLVSVDVELSDQELMTIADDIDKELYGAYEDDGKGLDEGESAPSYEAPSAKGAVDGLTLRGAAPDWLFTGTWDGDPGQGGTGGPGAYPVPAVFSDTSWYGCPVDDPDAPFAFHLNEEIGPGGDKLVEVAILDTVPTPCDLERAYRYFHVDHPLIASLFGENGQFKIPNDRLRIDYADPALMDPLNMPGTGMGLLGYGYTLADHGTFITGIVHTIVPKAKLRLIEVLNDYGVGSLMTIAAGLEKLKPGNRDLDCPLVVNLSLMMNMPLDDGHDWVGPEWDRLRSQPFQRRMTRFVHWVLDVLRGQDVLVVAAAGNDGKAGVPAPAARYPAAFDDVIGVGALNKDYQMVGGLYDVVRATYSNVADNPGYNGFCTFGGDALPDGKTDPTKGMLGTYIAEFPGHSGLTRNGWARWAGTSFATPVVAGVLARLKTEGVANPVQKLRDLVPEPLTNSEQLLIVDQG